MMRIINGRPLTPIWSHTLALAARRAAINATYVRVGRELRRQGYLVYYFVSH